MWLSTCYSSVVARRASRLTIAVVGWGCMTRVRQRLCGLTLLLLAMFSCPDRACVGSSAAYASPAQGISIRDVLVRPRIVCDELVCFAAALTLWEGAAMSRVRRSAEMRHSPIRLAIQPAYSDGRGTTAFGPDMADLVISDSESSATERYREAGLFVTASHTAPLLHLIEPVSFVDAHTKSMRQLATGLGPHAQNRARAWADYVDAKVAFVWSRTRYRSLDMRPRATYLAAELDSADGGVTPCVYTYAHLGGVKMARVTSSGTWRARSPSMSELIEWNPELIIVARSETRTRLLAEPRLQTLHAVAHRAVFTLPATAFAWDDGPESVLLMLWIAKLAHPALFPDLHLDEEVRSYYEQFYGIDLSVDELVQMLGG